jgi:hypothetical protein
VSKLRTGHLNNVEYRSAPYFDKATSILEAEPGPPQVESVQARLAMCLYLLSTFRINECWYRFGMTTLIIMAMGLHRKTENSKTENSKKIGLVEQECRKRAFWSAYILDRYLSVMKGRPRIFRDEDIDQEYPVNVDDDDMVFTDKDLIAVLPLRGLLEASINHAKFDHRKATHRLTTSLTDAGYLPSWETLQICFTLSDLCPREICG